MHYTLERDFFIFIPPNAAIIAPTAIKPPPSPAILAEFPDSPALIKDIVPPIMMRIPVAINIIPNPLNGCFLEIKNAINDNIIGGMPNPTPRVMASKGKKPSPAPPPPTITSMPYITKRIMEIPDSTCGTDTMLDCSCN